MVACEYCTWKEASNLFIYCCGNSNEALRLQPPVPSGSQRTVAKGKGAKVLGKL
jgi:hypothetical protein